MSLHNEKARMVKTMALIKSYRPQYKIDVKLKELYDDVIKELDDTSAFKCLKEEPSQQGIKDFAESMIDMAGEDSIADFFAVNIEAWVREHHHKQRVKHLLEWFHENMMIHTDGYYSLTFMQEFVQAAVCDAEAGAWSEIIDCERRTLKVVETALDDLVDLHRWERMSITDLALAFLEAFPAKKNR
jgi:hypothetical protein